MRVAPGCAAAAAQLVAVCCPAAVRRPEHWQAQSHEQEPEPEGPAAEAGSSGSAQCDASTHLSFAIPQGDADLPALFAALEGGRWARGACTHAWQQANAAASRCPCLQQSAGPSTGRHVGAAPAKPLPLAPLLCRVGAGVQEYSLSQTTLEQVFLALAQGSGQPPPLLLR